MADDKNLWREEGVVRKNLLLKCKLTVHRTPNTWQKIGDATKPTGATESVGSDGTKTYDYSNANYFDFHCKSKGLPAFADAPTWTDVTDNANEITGFAYAGKSEQLDVIEITARTPLQTTYENLLACQANGVVFKLTYTYDDPHETYIYTIDLPMVEIVGLSPSGGDTGSGSELTIKLLAEGGTKEQMPTVSAQERRP